MSTYVDFNTLSDNDLYLQLDTIKTEIDDFNELKSRVEMMEKKKSRHEYVDFTQLNLLKKRLRELDLNQEITNAIQDYEEISNILKQRGAEREKEKEIKISSLPPPRVPEYAQSYAQSSSNALSSLTTIPLSTKLESLSIDELKSLQGEIKNVMSIKNELLKRYRELADLPEEEFTQVEHDEYYNIEGKLGELNAMGIQLAEENCH